DLGVRDPLPVQLALQAAAVAAPGGAVHRHCAQHRSLYSFAVASYVVYLIGTIARPAERAIAVRNGRRYNAHAPEAIPRIGPVRRRISTTITQRLWTTFPAVAPDLAAWRRDCTAGSLTLPCRTG